MTKIAFTIAVVFALSYIPLFLLKVAKHWFNENDLSEVEFESLKIAERFYIINHVANPFIYAVFDNRFRRSVRTLVSFRRRGSHDEKYKIDHSTEQTASTIVL
ncbi:Hypothetical predicted protein [Mytilus galloprovincialis]|nr:Hypothetical predicted protein [Mytilus galloprovincialis]